MRVNKRKRELAGDRAELYVVTQILSAAAVAPLSDHQPFLIDRSLTARVSLLISAVQHCRPVCLAYVALILLVLPLLPLVPPSMQFGVVATEMLRGLSTATTPGLRVLSLAATDWLLL